MINARTLERSNARTPERPNAQNRTAYCLHLHDVRRIDMLHAHHDVRYGAIDRLD